MSKKGKLYNLRRKVQAVLTKMTSYEFMSRIYYFIVFKKMLNLKNPSDFNEKLQWLKLNYFPYNEDVIRCTDKYLVREYLKEKELEKCLNELIGVWDKWEEVDWDSLPNQFVLKCNHGCRYNIICKDKNNLSKEEVGKQINQWMSEDFSLFNAEKHYTSIKRKIICEKYLGDDITDYKFFCFHGKPKFFFVGQNRRNDLLEYLTFYYFDGTEAPFKRKGYKQFYDNSTLPENLHEMIEISKVLSADFPFVRVDFFEIEGNIVFSEMTYTPAGGFMKVYPEDFLRKWGEMISIE